MSFKSQLKINLLGVDTGGTFTDFVHYDGSALRFHKVLSTPDAPEQAIMQGIRAMNLQLQGLRIIHGSTVATNAVLQNKGVRTVYVANKGLKDVLSIARQTRQDLYDLQPQKIPPPVPAGLCLEVDTRRDANGEVLTELSDDKIQALVQQVHDLKPEAVAINLLFSYLNGDEESRLAAVLADDYFVSCSHRILPEYREYERGITTWLNASVGPLVQGYLQRFSAAVQPATVSIMRSAGQTCDTTQAGQEAVHLLLSGPAGGLAAAQYIGQQIGSEQLLSIDMGGTSTDVAMIDGDIRLTNKGHIGRYPVGIPMVDMHTIGAGGGSIASLDPGGRLQVGPESAGSKPGPVCYALGGEAATVTDANLILGHIPKQAKLGGDFTLDYDAACKAMKPLAEQLKLDTTEQAAAGIVQIVNENMTQALRLISVQRGIDPTGFTLIAFGGAGGLHLCALAEAMQMSRAVVPAQAGVLSALGMLVAPPGRQLSRTLAVIIDTMSDHELDLACRELQSRGRNMLQQEGINLDQLQIEYTVDLCYHGQTSTLNLPLMSCAELKQTFHTMHEQRFGHRLDSAIELVNVRVSLNAVPHDVQFPEQTSCDTPIPVFYENVYACKKPVPVFNRHELPVSHIIPGPAIIIDAVSTTFVAANWKARLDQHANLMLEFEPEGQAI